MRIHPIATAMIAAIALTACSEDQQELRGWMEEQRRNTAPVTEKIEPPKKFGAFRYEHSGESDPFSPARLAVQVGERPSGGPGPDLARQREVLEGFPLESISMVGHVSDRSNRFALLQADGKVYQARVGNHAGQNFGVITRVSDWEVKLKELVRDAAGDWVERETVLQLQEGRK